MGNQGGREITAAAFARRPTDTELLILYQLQKKLYHRLVESPEHLGLLKRYWDLSFGIKQTAPAFARKSPYWRLIGGFSSENPAEDLRGMGELGLQCLLFFAENYAGEAAMMKRARGGYPFVKAAMAIARALCEIFRLVDEDGQSGKFPVTRTLYWQLLESEASFYRLFALLFLLFDELFCEEVARNWNLQDEIVCSIAVVAQLVDAAKLKMLRALVKAPMRVEDLCDLCSNAHHALDRKLNAHDLQSPVKRFAVGDIRTTPVSLWKQHGTQRKTMREACKSWRVSTGGKESSARDASHTECLNRLQPRQPEISFSPSELSHQLSTIEETISIDGDHEEEEEKDEEKHPEAHKYEKHGFQASNMEPEVEVDIFKGLVLTKLPIVSVVSPTGFHGGLGQAAVVS